MRRRLEVWARVQRCLQRQLLWQNKALETRDGKDRCWIFRNECVLKQICTVRVCALHVHVSAVYYLENAKTCATCFTPQFIQRLFSKWRSILVHSTCSHLTETDSDTSLSSLTWHSSLSAPVWELKIDSWPLPYLYSLFSQWQSVHTFTHTPQLSVILRWLYLRI